MFGDPQEKEEIIEEPKVNTKYRSVAWLAHLISFTFHPVFMPTIMAYAMYRFVPAYFAGISSKEYSFKYLLPIFIITAFFPIISVLIMKGLDFIKSIHLYDPKDRIIPLITSMVFYFWMYWVFKNINAPFMLRVLTLGGFWGIIALFMVNIFYKVSMHTAGAGGMLGMLIVLMMLSPVSLTLPLFLGLIVAGIIGTARLLLGAHQPSEIWLGYILGIVVQVSAYFFLT
jgi:membrane-associated phospholipid phosphatase